ncbi:MAG: GDP-mannose 4,6-dehydratase [Deltaproteobacteria bacterium]|nr:GDP-mannose 4,6-dehydratase [bacterium]MCB9478217.1 GDP-mannose 4,6-dehydratase [Deltaproteobacteria bacterium]MCB9487230.1 GDP-mannose 4,6-dehydratase [Deltaproteobacteria bacterium]
MDALRRNRQKPTVLVTGGAGFIGRWVVAELLRRGQYDVTVLDNLQSGSKSNLSEFIGHPRFTELIVGDVRDWALLDDIFERRSIHTVFHLAACINVQESIDEPTRVFQADVVGTFDLLERARRYNSRFVFMSTCMVYDRCSEPQGIAETSPTKPASPYAGAKLAAENMVLGYHHAYGMPVTILRPFNTYGPYQRADGEGGVVSIFCDRADRGQMLNIYGDGTQTRDLLYVEDCARFVVDAGMHPAAEGRVLNAATGRDVTINELAKVIVGDESRIAHVKHIHPQSEIPKLLGNSDRARELIGWEPVVSLEEGIARTRNHLAAANTDEGTRAGAA